MYMPYEFNERQGYQLQAVWSYRIPNSALQAKIIPNLLQLLSFIYELMTTRVGIILWIKLLQWSFREREKKQTLYFPATQIACMYMYTWPSWPFTVLKKASDPARVSKEVEWDNLRQSVVLVGRRPTGRKIRSQIHKNGCKLCQNKFYSISATSWASSQW